MCNFLQSSRTSSFRSWRKHPADWNGFATGRYTSLFPFSCVNYRAQPGHLGLCGLFFFLTVCFLGSQAGGQTPKVKPKVLEEGDQRDTMMSMISMASSESTVAGLMSLSAPPSASSSSSMADKEQVASGSAQTWSGKGQGGPEEQQQQQQPNHEVHTPAKVSLSEYRAKNADVLAAQKRKLENMEASVKRDYANAAQALIGQQQRKEKQQHHHQQSSASSDMSNPSPIILKIPLEKERHDRSSLKMRFPIAGGGGSGHSGNARGQDQDIKVRIRVPEKQRGSSGEEGKSRDKHRERSNHHHHHHHHHHHSSSSGASLSSSHKHSSSSSSSGALGSNKKLSSDSTRTGSSSSSASRKRTHSQDPTAGSHPASKVSKSSRNPYQLPPLSSSGQSLGPSPDILPALGLPHHQGSFPHSKSDKTDTNGHGTSGQSNEYQDTFEMLNSLLSAQGVQPSQPSMFDYRSQYGDYRYAAGSRGNNPRPPPLPSDPPPPLPPLPKWVPVKEVLRTVVLDITNIPYCYIKYCIVFFFNFTRFLAGFSVTAEKCTGEKKEIFFLQFTCGAIMRGLKNSQNVCVGGFTGKCREYFFLFNSKWNVMTGPDYSFLGSHRLEIMRKRFPIPVRSSYRLSFL